MHAGHVRVCVCVHVRVHWSPVVVSPHRPYVREVEPGVRAPHCTRSERRVIIYFLIIIQSQYLDVQERVEHILSDRRPHASNLKCLNIFLLVSLNIKKTIFK